MDLVCVQVQNTLQQCSDEKLKYVPALGGVSFAVSCVEVEGDASFALRRGKRILCYEVAVSFKWVAQDEYGSSLGAKGTGSVSELTQEEDSPHVVVEVSTTCSGGGEAKAAGRWMQQHGSGAIGEFLSGPRLSSAILKAEEARVDISAHEALRAEEHAKTELAERATAEERAKLAAEQKRREEAGRVEPTEGAVKGSVWNVNAWHWEEKPMNDWAHAWLARKLNGLTVSLLGGLASAVLSEAKVIGDASVSVRKGKPIALFLLNLQCTWTVTASIEGVGDARGILRVPEFTSEDCAKDCTVEVETSPGSSGKKPSPQIVSVFRRDGVKAVRSVLGQFEEQIRGHLSEPAKAS